MYPAVIITAVSCN